MEKSEPTPEQIGFEPRLLSEIEEYSQKLEVLIRQYVNTQGLKERENIFVIIEDYTESLADIFSFIFKDPFVRFSRVSLLLNKIKAKVCTAENEDNIVQLLFLRLYKEISAYNKYIGRILNPNEINPEIRESLMFIRERLLKQ